MVAAMHARLAIVSMTSLLLGACTLADDPNRVIYSRGPGVAEPGGWTYRTSPFGYGYDRGPYGSAWDRRDWDDDDRSQSRVLRSGRGVSCDRRTEVCYKRGRIDKSETEERFGERAGDRADRFRDRFGSNAIVTGRNSYCDRGDKVCYKNGNPDRSDTRDMFGRKAARRID
jgi:hypothetical protein